MEFKTYIIHDTYLYIYAVIRTLTIKYHAACAPAVLLFRWLCIINSAVIITRILSILENKTSSFNRDCLRNTIAKIYVFQKLPCAVNESYCIKQ